MQSKPRLFCAIQPFAFNPIIPNPQVLVDLLREKCIEERGDAAAAAAPPSGSSPPGSAANGAAAGAATGGGGGSSSQAPEEWSLDAGRPCGGERPLLMFDRWRKLLRSFYSDKKGTFDISKVGYCVWDSWLDLLVAEEPASRRGAGVAPAGFEAAPGGVSPRGWAAGACPSSHEATPCAAPTSNVANLGRLFPFELSKRIIRNQTIRRSPTSMTAPSMMLSTTATWRWRRCRRVCVCACALRVGGACGESDSVSDAL